MRLLHTSIKMALVGLFASLLANLFHLDYWMTAGIIAILCINLTKKDSLVMSLKRLIGVFFGLALSTLLFLVFGYHFWLYSIFIFIYAYLSWLLKMPEGIVPGLVLVTHLLVQGSFSISLLLNEVYIMIIAVGVSTLFNLIYPTTSEMKLNRYVGSVDQLIRDHLYMLSMLLKDPEYKEEYYIHFERLDYEISHMISQVEVVDKDILFLNDHAYLSYFYMRKEQSNYIRHMYKQALNLFIMHPFANEISTFILELSYDIGQYNKAVVQLEKLEDLKKKYKLSNLPLSRDEFETRASLYQILNEIESLLEVKIVFHQEFPNFEHHILKA